VSGNAWDAGPEFDHAVLGELVDSSC